MASSGPRYATSGVTALGGAPETRAPWVNPGNAAQGASEPSDSEAAVTAANYDAGYTSEQLRLTGYGFSIPDGATINGVTVVVRRRYFAGGPAVDYRVQLWNDAQIGDNKALTGTNWPSATLGNQSYGGTADGWNANLTAAIVNASTFGVVLSATANGANTDIGVAWISITVEYTEHVPEQFPKSVSGGVTFSGSLARSLSARRSLTAGLTFSGGLSTIKQLHKSVSGALTFTGGLTRATRKPLSGAVGFSVSFDPQKQAAPEVGDALVAVHVHVE